MNKPEHLDENLRAADIELTPDDLREIDNTFSKLTVQGGRLSSEHMALIDS
jgi:pyridoxine 4-dehydrogenase